MAETDRCEFIGRRIGSQVTFINRVCSNQGIPFQEGPSATECHYQPELSRFWNLPVDYSIALPHIAEVLHQLPNRWISDKDFIRINREQSKARASKQVRNVTGVWVGWLGVTQSYTSWSYYAPVIGDTLGEIPPSRST